MDNGRSFEMGGQLGQAAVECVTTVGCLFKRGAFDFLRVPAFSVKGDVLMGLDLKASDARVWNYEEEVQFGSKPTVPWCQVQGVQSDPILRPAGEHVEDVVLAGRRVVVHE